MKIKILPLASLLIVCSGTPWAANSMVPPHILSIPEALRHAEQTSPQLKAALEREHGAEQTITVFKSAYYPRFDVEAIDSYGFPGSSRDLGISGLMGSPFRSGPAAGMTGNLTLYDAGRGYEVRSAREQLKAVREQTEVTRFSIDQATLQIYVDAARFRGQQTAYAAVADDVAAIAKEVERFVHTGQRSVVDRLLVEDQTTDAQMSAAAYQERYRVALQRLALTTGFDSQPLSCPAATDLTEQSLGILSTGSGSPLVNEAAAQARAARANVSFYSAQNLPKLMATGSVGDMDESRVVSKKYYSGGFGLTLPLFEGYRVSGQIHQAQALAAQRDQDVNAARFEVDDINAHYDEVINSSRVQLDYLRREVDVANHAFTLAKQRYFSFQGTLVDVREAIRNLERIQSEIIDVQSDLLLAAGSKALLNGGVLAEKS